MVDSYPKPTSVGRTLHVHVVQFTIQSLQSLLFYNMAALLGTKLCISRL